MIGLGARRSHDSSAVVTGAGSGIGRAFALELSRRGGNVVCSDIDLAAAERTAAEIAGHGGKARALHCDVSRVDDVETLARDAQDWLAGLPTFVVNNAGVGAGGERIGQTPLADWQWTLGVNLWGAVHGCHVFAPLLRQAARGRQCGIVNVASAASFAAAPRMAAYNVSKAGVLALSETLAAELAGSGVYVSVLCPTFVKTNILDDGRIAAGAAGLADTLMRTTGMSPERVARICLDRHDRGALYVLPQLDAKAAWQLKRYAPRSFTRLAGVLGRFGPVHGAEPQDVERKEG